MGCNFVDDCEDCQLGGVMGCDPDLPNMSFDDWLKKQHYPNEEPYCPPEEVYYESESIENEIGKTVKHCVSCGKQADKNWSYCPNCGTVVTKRCVSCDQQIDDGWAYCPGCGSHLVEEQEEIPF